MNVGRICDAQKLRPTYAGVINMAPINNDSKPRLFSPPEDSSGFWNENVSNIASDLLPNYKYTNNANPIKIFVVGSFHSRQSAIF